MKVGIFINTTKGEANKAANEFGRMLLKNNVESKVVNLKEDCKDIDVIAVFGGDGTILRVVDYALSFDIPILAVNTGSLGFLTCVEKNDLKKAVDLIVYGGTIEKRSVMKVVSGGNKYYALNEALIQRYITGGSVNGVAKISLEIGGKFVDNYVADGIIISTPTGSTAYSLSAGGAIMTPDLNAFIVTPVCAHSLHNKPIVYGDGTTSIIKVSENSYKCSLFIDGKFEKLLQPGDEVEISKSRKMIKFYATESTFFEKLLYKLNKWSDTDA